MTPEQNPATENNRTAEAIMRFPWTHGVLVCKPENGRGTEKRRIRLRKIRAVRNACGGKTCAAQEFSVQTEEITGRKAVHRNYRPQEFARLLEETLIPACAAGEFFAGGEILSLKKNRRGRVTLLKNRNRQTDTEERRGTEEHNREKKRNANVRTANDTIEPIGKRFFILFLSDSLLQNFFYCMVECFAVHSVSEGMCRGRKIFAYSLCFDPL